MAGEDVAPAGVTKRRSRARAAPENRRGPSVAGARQFRAFAGAAPALPARNRYLGLRWGSARGHNDPLPGAG